MYSFFTALADAYSAVLMPDKELRGRLEADATDRGAILERCLKRLEWEGAREREAQEAADEAEKEREAMAQVGWLQRCGMLVVVVLSVSCGHGGVN